MAEAPLSAQNAESGVVVEFVPSTALPSIPGGLRTVGLIGKGQVFKTLNGVTVTRGVTANGIDSLSLKALTLPGTIVDENLVSYTLSTDYSLSLPTSTSAASPATTTTSGDTLTLNINADGVQTIILATSATGAAVAADIQGKVRALTAASPLNQGAYDTFTAAFTGGLYVLTSGTTPIGSVVVTGGTAAVALKLGVANSGVEVQGGNVNWGPAGAAVATGSTDVSSVIFPFGVNLDGLTFQVFINGSPSASNVTFVGTTIDPTNYTAIAGTVAVTNGSAAVVGTATTFTTDLVAGGIVQFASQAGVSYRILSITDNLNLTLTTNYTGTTNAATTLSNGDGIIEQMTVGLPATVTPSVFVNGAENYIRLSTVSTSNASLQIGNGTANTSLGFVAGILIAGPAEPAAGVTYTFSYGTPKVTADYAPVLYTNLDDMISAYGPVSTSNTLSLGGQIVFENSNSTGAILAVQVNPADGSDLAGFQSALSKMATVDGVSIVVPLTTDAMLYPSVKSHVVNSSAPLEKKERTAILGLNPSSTTISSAISQAQSLAAGGNGRRMMLVWPSSVNRIIGSTEVTLDGSFLAAGIAGLRINGNFDVAEPMLRKQVVGFTSAATNLLRTDKLRLRNGGVTVVELIDNLVRITEDTTTDRSTVDSQEFPVTEIVDFVARTVRRLLDSIFIGVKILPDTASIVSATVQVLLNNFIALNIITSSQNVKASVNPLDPRQLDVSFEIQPVRGLRFIKVTFSI